MPRRGFIIFWIFLLFFSEFSCPGQIWTEFRTKTFFFSLFRPISFQFWIKIMSERGFVIFWIFLLLFSEFSCLGRIRMEFGIKIFFSLFLSLFQPVLDRNNAGIKFFNFFWNFLSRSEYERNSGLKFFFLFFDLSHLVLAKNYAGMRFLIFWIFLLFFSEFSCLGRVLTEFRTKIFLSLFRHISSRFG